MQSLNLATPAVLEVMNQFTPRHSVDNMARLSNADMADMHTWHTANDQERFPNRHFPGYCMLTNQHSRLREHRSVNDNRRGAAILPYQSSCKHPSCSMQLRNTKPCRRIACSQGQPSNPYHFQKVQDLLTNDYLLIDARSKNRKMNFL